VPHGERATSIRWRRLLTAILIGVVSIYLIIALSMVIFQRHLVYFPSAIMNADPSDVGLDFEEVVLTTEDAVKLHAWFVPAEEDRAAVLFCHGNAGNISGRLAMLELLHDLGLSTLIFDYRGYGKSDGTPSEEGTYLDGQAAWHHLTKVRGYEPNRIMLFGRSLGGGIASRIAVENKPAALVLMSTFTSLPAIGQEAYPYMPVKLLSRYRYPVLTNLHRVDAPVLVMHGRDDEVIPYHHGEELFTASGRSSQFVQLPGGHNDALMTGSDIISRAIERLLDEHLR